MKKYANRHNAKRDGNEKPIVQILKAVGATVWRLDQPVDLLVGFRGSWHLAEVKMPGAKLNAAQALFCENNEGAPVRILTSVDEALNWVNELKDAD